MISVVFLCVFAPLRLIIASAYRIEAKLNAKTQRRKETSYLGDIETQRRRGNYKFLVISASPRLCVSAFFIVLLSLTTSCCRWKPAEEYSAFYAHLKTSPQTVDFSDNSSYSLTIFVDAKHLDYTDAEKLLHTIAKHPDDASKHGDVGHAWLRLEGEIDGVPFVLEGGHSGELGLTERKYFQGVMDQIDNGHANPVEYLWRQLHDGFFQQGAGRHKPTFSAKFSLTKEQFQSMVHFISHCYDFSEYSLTLHQCCTFVCQVAALAGIDLKTEVTIDLPSSVYFGGEALPLWSDRCYSQLSFPSPDILERSLIHITKFVPAPVPVCVPEKKTPDNTPG